MSLTQAVLAAQAATDGFDIGRLLGAGGPLGAAGLLLGYLAKLWLDSRKEKRQETLTERESESGIVETTRAAIQMVREQMVEMGKEISTLKTLREEDAKIIAKLERRVRELETENEYLKGHQRRPAD
jgi:predicted RNase H-like nuclease (RuvC/YqgF family)